MTAASSEDAFKPTHFSYGYYNIAGHAGGSEQCPNPPPLPLSASQQIDDCSFGAAEDGGKKLKCQKMPTQHGSLESETHVGTTVPLTLISALPISSSVMGYQACLEAFSQRHDLEQ